MQGGSVLYVFTKFEVDPLLVNSLKSYSGGPEIMKLCHVTTATPT